ncbi:tetratricopeptide repeat protein [Allohahella marinimesophila]|uniref:Tetratricopeptide repeat protein n=1 Tax=Allohahella marinimesophila TaxID=1054972 RepID=A0ABP7QCR2_9GAMM
MKHKYDERNFTARVYGHTAGRRALKVCLASFLILVFAGCESNEEKALKRAQIQFSSHIDQASFFMNQGQLKAAMLEAQNARKLLPAEPEPYLLMADALLTTGDARQALQVYQEILGSDEAKAQPGVVKIEATQADMNTARLGMASTQMLLGDINAATQALDELQEPSAEQQAAALVLRGNLALARRELTDAEAFYRQAMEQDAASIDAYIGLSKVSFIKEDMGAANEAITKAETIQAESSELWLWKAQLAAAQNRFAEAETAYIKALEKIGQYDVMTMQKFQTISQLVEALRAQSKFAEAFTYQEILDKSGPGNIRSNYEQALEAIQANDLDKAEGLLLSILESAPGHKQAGIMLGIVKFQQGEWAMADMYLSQYGGDNVNDVVSRVMAETKLHMKEPEAAKALMSGLPQETSDNLSIFGMAEIATGNLTAGIEALKKALALDEGNVGILEQLTKALLREGKPDEALEALEQAIVRAPNQEKIRSMIVAVHASQKDWSKAEKAIAAWKRRSPDSALAFNAEGALLMQQDKKQDAIRAFEKAKKSNEKLATPYFNLIRLYLSQEEDALALAEARAGVQNMPANMMMIRSYLDLSSRQEKLEDGIEFLRTVAEQNSAAAPSLVLAEYYGRTNQFKDARGFLNRARESGADPSAVEGLELLLAETEIPLLIQAKRLDQARKLADSVGSSFPSSPEAQLLRAKVELSAGDEKAGFDQLSRINRKYPQQPIAFEFLGDYYFSKENFEKAVGVYQKAWLRAPSQTLAIKMHRALREANSTVKSLEPLKQWLEINPDSPQASTLLAMGYQAAGMNDEAIELYEKIRQSRPADAVALNNLAWLYYERKDERALEAAAEAYRLRPDNSAIADTYALVLLQQTDETAKAIEILEKAVEAEPENEELKKHLEDARAASAKSS